MFLCFVSKICGNTILKDQGKYLLSFDIMIIIKIHNGLIHVSGLYHQDIKTSVTSPLEIVQTYFYIECPI